MTDFVGIDLGQGPETSSLVVVQGNHLPSELWHETRGGSTTYQTVFRLPDGTMTKEHPPVSYAVRHIDRFPVGTAYRGIVDQLLFLKGTLSKPTIAIDATAVGRAPLKLFEAAGFDPSVVTMSAGDVEFHDGRHHRVPKRELISQAQVILQDRRLKIPSSLPHGALLAKELQCFRYRVELRSGADTVEAWREGQNDDLVFALALALWIGERNFPGGGLIIVSRPERRLGIIG